MTLSPSPPSDEAALIRALRAKDEAAFEALITRYHPTLVRLAQMYVADRATAEDMAQETWLGVLRGLDRFEGRSSLKTWLFRILTNRAKTRGQRERRSIPFSAWEDADSPTVPSERFIHDDPEWKGHWAIEPRGWDTLPEARVQSQETFSIIRRAIEALPLTQREVITLRDVEGWPAVEVCNALEISETNQRVLLHRARAKVRQALEHYFEDSMTP